MLESSDKELQEALEFASEHLENKSSEQLQKRLAADWHQTVQEIIYDNMPKLESEDDDADSPNLWLFNQA